MEKYSNNIKTSRMGLLVWYKVDFNVKIKSVYYNINV